MPQNSNGRHTGTVVWFTNTYGFIKIDGGKEGDADLFVHESQIQMTGYRTLRQGQRVEFEIGTRNERPMAESLIPLD